MTVSRARMLGLARPACAPLSRHASATRVQVPGRVAPAFALAVEQVAMASAMVKKLPLNMLTPDTGLDYLD